MTATQPLPVQRSSARIESETCPGAIERDLDERLGVGPRDEHAAVDAERAPVELALAQDVRDGLARAAPLDQLAERA